MDRSIYEALNELVLAGKLGLTPAPDMPMAAAMARCAELGLARGFNSSSNWTTYVITGAGRAALAAEDARLRKVTESAQELAEIAMGMADDYDPELVEDLCGAAIDVLADIIAAEDAAPGEGQGVDDGE